MKTPLMLDTKRMAIHDGPGIRTTFFVKGCPLHCVWCHNPESISPERTGGGVTLSGGEPLFFWEWTAELLKRFKAEGLHTCLDTSLYAPPAAIDAVMPFVDMWLPDFKCDDDTTHQKFTGVSNKIIKKNLERLVAAKAKLEVRCLVVPGCTEDVSARYAYLDSFSIPRKDIVELEYFDYARSKYQALGMPDTMPKKRDRKNVDKCVVERQGKELKTEKM